MSNLVFVTGDFCSGSTLVFTLFREARLYYCLYEPLHELLLEHLMYRVQPLPHDHHFFAKDYYRELRGFDRIHMLFDPRWGSSDLFLEPSAEAEGLYRYLAYIIGMSFGRSQRVMLKENRLSFRIGWIRTTFPHAKIVHIHRRKEDQWKSVVRRVQAHVGREDVGQHSVHFAGFNLATWCEDLRGRFPELEATRSQTGFERFSKLWELSYEQNTRYADISIDYWDLTHDFEAVCERMWQAVGVTGIDTARLKKLVVAPENQTAALPQGFVSRKTRGAIDKLLRKYARARVRLRAQRHEPG